MEQCHWQFPSEYHRPIKRKYFCFSCCTASWSVAFHSIATTRNRYGPMWNGWYLSWFLRSILLALSSGKAHSLWGECLQFFRWTTTETVLELSGLNGLWCTTEKVALPSKQTKQGKDISAACINPLPPNLQIPLKLKVGRHKKLTYTESDHWSIKISAIC